MRTPQATVTVLARTDEAADEYRLRLPAQAANAAQSDIAFNVVSDLSELELGCSDALILRGLTGREVLDPVERFVRRGGRLIVDFDAYIEPPPYHPSAGRFLSWRPTPELLAGTADLVMVASSALADAMKAHSDKIVVRPSIVSTATTGDGRAAEEPSEKVTVVWGGDSSRNLGIRYAASALRALQEEGRPIRLRTFGGGSLDSLGLSPGSIAVYPRQSLSRYLEILASADIAIAPYEDTLFDTCKPDTLILEYAAAGLPCVASDCPLTRGLRDAGAPLLVASSPGDWYTSLKSLVDDETDRRRTAGGMRAFGATLHGDAGAGHDLVGMIRSVLDA